MLAHLKVFEALTLLTVSSVWKAHLIGQVQYISNSYTVPSLSVFFQVEILQAMKIDDDEPLVRIERGVCKVRPMFLSHAGFEMSLKKMWWFSNFFWCLEKFLNIKSTKPVITWPMQWSSIGLLTSFVRALFFAPSPSWLWPWPCKQSCGAVFFAKNVAAGNLAYKCLSV